MILTEARAHYDAFRLREAYALYRRYFEVLPRGVTSGHVESVSAFVMSSMALGRRDELEFYTGVAAKLHCREMTPESRYVLAFLYQVAREPQWEESRALADGALRDG